jgi:hypothetical protein
VSNTPQAKEAIIANGVPQGGVISRKEAKLEPIYDGKPEFQPVEGTALQYAVNSPTPIIQVDPRTYYAVENGVWFTAPSPEGPWQVASSVPPVIYTIPPSSPINFVTYAYVYGATPEVVYTGYTPGYLGTCVCPESVVVYGTGWAFRPWIGARWFGRPWTYGWGARFGYTTAGWGFGFSAGWGRPWGGPVGWHAGWGGTAWRAGWQNGWGGRYGNAHVNHVNFNNFNVYNRWGNNVHVNNANRTVIAPRRQAAATTNVQRGVNNVLAGRDGNVYRPTTGGFERHTNKGWQNYSPKVAKPEVRPQVQNNVRQLQNDWSARQTGQANAQQFRAATGNHAVARPAPQVQAPAGRGAGGFHGGAGGFRGGGGRRR